MPNIAILGASGLIGSALALDMRRRRFALRPYARRFTAAQAKALGDEAVQTPLVSLSNDALYSLLSDADIIVNCIGVLQDGPSTQTNIIHRAFVAKLVGFCAAEPKKLLIHVSVPGEDKDDRTAFSRSKREAERIITASGAPFVILRPGFVITPAAYGGSALIRALAALPLRMPRREARTPFAATAMADICETVARVAARWRNGETSWCKIWDVVEQAPGSVGAIVELFRAHNGGPTPLFALPSPLLDIGVRAGDLVAWLGWKPPIRSTAIQEMRRGVTGEPAQWMADTGIAPRSALQALSEIPATIQERWFARLYLLKALAIVSLVLFWGASGLIALTITFHPARDILVAHGFSVPLANTVTIASSLADILIGCAIAWRRSCRIGLVAGIAVSLCYMVGAAITAPDLWIEPLGALVKTVPAIVLMLVCIALLDSR